MTTLLEEARDCLNGMAELYDANDAKDVVRKIDTHSPIVVTARVHRCNHNRKLFSVEITAGPPHVLLHCQPSGEQLADDASEVFRTLSEYGYEYTVVTEFMDVSPIEMMHLLGD